MPETRHPISVVAFRQQVAEGKTPDLENVVLFKQDVLSEVGRVQADGGAVDVSRRRTFVISSDSVDRDNDVINQAGWQLGNYQANPVVLWAHDYSSLPVGKCVELGVRGHQLIATAEFADHPMASTVLSLVDGGFLRATSVGFRPLPGKYTVNEQRGGMDFESCELLEFSIVPVPANPDALIMARAAGIDLAPIKGWADGVLKSLAVQKVVPQAKPKPKTDAPIDAEDLVRWNRTLSKAFDVESEPAEVGSVILGWASRHCGVPVKDLYQLSISVPSARMGSYLSALGESLIANWRVESIRNLNYQGKEVPPVYESIQLNSKLTRSFLIEGARFVACEQTKAVVQIDPTWYGVSLTYFCPLKSAGFINDWISATYERAAQYKFLKGEAFSLGGEFLERGAEDWPDLFLPPVNLEPISRNVKLLNEKAEGMDSRGLILMGPPGTGKTLAGRIMMNQAKDATFIWISSRDFYRSGAFGGLTMAFDLAAENLPAIIFVEDIDSWLSSESVDLLKTELDGIKQRKGILTVLTTNFPEYLPEALIDRPGRFHDVLNMNLPTETIRRAMLASWAPDANAKVLDQLAADTRDFSGAHIRDLVRYANVLRDQDGTALDAALLKAYTKIVEQRQAIDDARSANRRRDVSMTVKGLLGPTDLRMPTKGDAVPVTQPTVGTKCAACDKDVEVLVVAKGAAGVCQPCFAKRGRVLSTANEARIRQAKENLEAVLVQIAAAPDSSQETEEVPLVEDPKRAKDPMGEGDVSPECCAENCTGKMGRSQCAAAGCDHYTCADHANGGMCWHCAGSAKASREQVLVLDDDEIDGLALDNDVQNDGLADFSAEDFRAAIKAALADAPLDAIIRQQTESALRRHRGGVD